MITWTKARDRRDPTWISDDGRWEIRHSTANNNSLFHLADLGFDVSRGLYPNLSMARNAANWRVLSEAAQRKPAEGLKQ